mmetsp:Transcript_33686/g.38372  ORF Transcript_33686/g.38372 Transcript_33686/m.38372 type:complete len:117 (-) Transcript_33686:250-600(-)
MTTFISPGLSLYLLQAIWCKIEIEALPKIVTRASNVKRIIVDAIIIIDSLLATETILLGITGNISKRIISDATLTRRTFMGALLVTVKIERKKCVVISQRIKNEIQKKEKQHRSGV